MLDNLKLLVIVDNETDTLSSVAEGVPQTPEAAIRTRISPGPATGRGRSSTRRSLLE